MRKIANWALGIAFIIALIDWGIMGVKLLENDYNITVEAHIGLVCYIVILVGVFIRIFTDRCPHCGKIRISKGEYCSYCGNKISK